jgi:NAD(P)-dependent dehydrogenase (short-subunit alcohol dehydrogenase family)
MSYKILITGANGAFGKLTVKKLLDDGHEVVASIRKPEGRNQNSVNELKAVGAHIVEIDVSHENSVVEGTKNAMDKVGGIDVVINNAGIGAFGIQETFTAKEWQKLFDVNVFGVQRMNRAILPHMRENKSGLLIHISSLIGRMVLPFWGVYSASKWALEALAETYRIELSKYGIDSCIIEPGAYPTAFFEGLMEPNDQRCTLSYGSFVDEAKTFFTDFANALDSNTEQNAQHIADAISKLINTPAGQRRFRTVVDEMGMGGYIEGYNNQHQQLIFEIFNAFGIEKMLKLQTNKDMSQG